jgi:hypothetical protein
VLEHFNGTSWTNVTVPIIGGIEDVMAISPTDACALDGHSVETELVALDVLHHETRLVVAIGRQ